MTGTEVAKIKSKQKLHNFLLNLIMAAFVATLAAGFITMLIASLPIFGLAAGTAAIIGSVSLGLVVMATGFILPLNMLLERAPYFPKEKIKKHESRIEHIHAALALGQKANLPNELVGRIMSFNGHGTDAITHNLTQAVSSEQLSNIAIDVAEKVSFKPKQPVADTYLQRLYLFFSKNIPTRPSAAFTERTPLIQNRPGM